jgi:hypothetical protein
MMKNAQAAGVIPMRVDKNGKQVVLEGLSGDQEAACGNLWKNLFQVLHQPMVSTVPTKRSQHTKQYGGHMSMQAMSMKIVLSIALLKPLKYVGRLKPRNQWVLQLIRAFEKRF